MCGGTSATSVGTSLSLVLPINIETGKSRPKKRTVRSAVPTSHKFVVVTAHVVVP